MGRKKAPVDKKRRTVRIPNPDAPMKERLRTPAHKRHASKKDYKRRGKHGKGWSE